MLLLFALPHVFGQENKITSLKNELKIGTSSLDFYDIYNDLSSEFYKNRQADSVIHYRKLSLRFAKTPKQQFDSYDALSNMYYIKRDMDLAVAYLDSCQIINSVLGNKKFEEDIHYRLGKIQATIGYFKDAEENLFKALKLGIKRDSLSKGVASNYREIARLYKRQGNSEDAMIYFKKSLEAYKRLGRNKTVIDLYDDISGVLIKQKQFDQALDYSLKSLELSNVENLDSNRSVTYSRLGRIYYLRNPKDFKKSYRFLKLAEKTRNKDELENRMHLERYWFNHYQLQKKTDSATIHFNKYLQLNDSLNQQKQKKSLAEFQKKLEVAEAEKKALEKDIQLGQAIAKNKKLWSTLFLAALALFGVAYTFYRFKKNIKTKSEIEFLKKTITRQQFESQFHPYLIEKFNFTAAEFEFLLLYKTDKKTQMQLSEELHISISGVKQRQQRLKEKLSLSPFLKGTFNAKKANQIYSFEENEFRKSLINS